MYIVTYAICVKCGEMKSAESFSKDKSTKTGLYCYCKKCMVVITKSQYEKHRTKRIRKVKEYHNILRNEIFNKYGNSCACCGESRREFLCIDHINGGGNKHRKSIGNQLGIGFYRWLRNNNWPQGFRTLCHNCNMALGFSGYCPHDRERNHNS